MKKYALSLLRSSVCAFAVIFSASAAFAQDAPAKKIKDHRTAPELFFLQEGDVPKQFHASPGSARRRLDYLPQRPGPL